MRSKMVTEADEFPGANASGREVEERVEGIGERLVFSGNQVMFRLQLVVAP
jgi:hypothetical protein